MMNFIFGILLISLFIWADYEQYQDEYKDRFVPTK